MTGDRLRLGGATVAKPNSPDQGAGQPSWLVRPDKRGSNVRWLVTQVIPLQ